jgi:hypothetical protein
MSIDSNRYRNMSRREILREFIDHVATSEEEQDKKEHRSGSSTDLNIYLLDNRSYEIGNLDNHINNITHGPRIDGYAKNFVEKHTFSEEIIRDDAAVVRITTPEKSRVDDSMWVSYEEYIWVLTIERQSWRKKIENLIKYLPQVERLYLSSDYLETLTSEDSIDDSYVSGFTAKYHAPYADRQATLRFYDGRKRDLEKTQRYFNAKPTRIEFDQINSPTAAIEAASTNDGRLSFQSVVQGSQEKAVETLLNISEEYQELDRESFEIEHSSKQTSLENGIAIDGFTAIELTDPDRNPEANGSLVEEIEENILNGTQYEYGQRGESTLRVCDTRHGEFFDIGVEPPDIVIYPRESATALSLRDIVQDIFDYDSTYSHEKVENPVATH